MRVKIVARYARQLFFVSGMALFASVSLLLVSGDDRAAAIGNGAPDILVVNGGSSSTSQTAFSVEDTPSTREATKTTVELFSKAQPVGNTSFNVTVTSRGWAPSDRYWGVNVRDVSGNSNNYTASSGNYAVPASRFTYSDLYQAWRATVAVEFAVNYQGIWQESSFSAEGRYAHFVVSTDAGKYVSYGSSDMFNVADKDFNDNPDTDSWPPKTYYVDMATPCGATTAKPATISLRDLDSSGRENGHLPVTVSVEDVTSGVPVVVPTSVGSTERDSWIDQPDMGNNRTFSFSLNFMPYHTYRVKISGVVPLNILQYKLPFDPINTAISCLDYSLYPQITFSDGARDKTASEGQKLGVQAYVANTGPSATPAYPYHIPYTIYTYHVPANQTRVDTSSKKIFDQQVTINAGGINTTVQYVQTPFGTLGQDGCKWLQVTFPASGAVCTLSGYDSDAKPIQFQGASRNSPDNFITGVDLDLSGYAPGDQICYFLAIRRFEPAFNLAYRDDPTRRVARPICVTVSKAPKVNILGGDLSVVGTGATTISTSLTTNTTAGRTTTYGSWAEYGVLSGGSVHNLASGAGLAGGVGGGVTNICPAQSLLTLANSKTTGCALGGYATEPASTRLQDRFKPFKATLSPGKSIDLSEGSPANPHYIGKNAIYGGASSGQLTISGGALGKGEWVVINAPNMDVKITGDITYYGGTLNALKDIPQLVIIAKNIDISESVGRIDGWLVASGTGNDGNLSTCSEISKDVMKKTAVGAFTSAHSGSRCVKQLTVNGPVIANHIYLYRTAGAGSQKAAGDPAERFNYRPDAYLWSLGYSSGGSGVPTVSTTELPPRF